MRDVLLPPLERYVGGHLRYCLLDWKARIVWRVIWGLTLVVGLITTTAITAAAQSLNEVTATQFFASCPGVIVVEESTRVTGEASIDGDCTVEVASDATLLLDDMRIRIRGDLIIEGEAKNVTIRQSQIRSEGAIFVSTSGNITVRNSKFVSEDVSFDAAGRTVVGRSNFEQVAGEVALMAVDSCETSYNVPDNIHCSVDPPSACPCFEASEIVLEVDQFLRTFNYGLIVHCQSPSIQAAAAGGDVALAISSSDSGNMCSVIGIQYVPEVLPLGQEVDLTEEELGACQLAVEQACEELMN